MTILPNMFNPEWPDEPTHFSECPAHEDNQTGECTCEDIAQGIYEDAGERKGDLQEGKIDEGIVSP